MKPKLKAFMHYWFAGLVLAVVGGIMFWLASIPSQIVSAKWGDETGAFILDSWWKGLIALSELTVLPFLFGWLMHRVVSRPNGIVRVIISEWIAKSEPEQEQDGAEHPARGDVQ